MDYILTSTRSLVCLQKKHSGAGVFSWCWDLISRILSIPMQLFLQNTLTCSLSVVPNVCQALSPSSRYKKLDENKDTVYVYV